MNQSSGPASTDPVLAGLLAHISRHRPGADAQLITRGYQAAADWHQDRRALVIKLADRLHNTRTIRYLPRAKQVDKSRQTLAVMVPLARTLGMDSIGAELESRAAATLRKRPGSASGGLLTVAAALLPPEARARWRAEWLAELQVLPTRREQLRFAVQIVPGIGRLTVTLHRQRLAGLIRAFRGRR
jgi:hypothetical protein